MGWVCLALGEGIKQVPYHSVPRLLWAFKCPLYICMGGCQNYCPRLGPRNSRCRTILRTQRGLSSMTAKSMQWYHKYLRTMPSYGLYIHTYMHTYIHTYVHTYVHCRTSHHAAVHYSTVASTFAFTLHNPMPCLSLCLSLSLSLSLFLCVYMYIFVSHLYTITFSEGDQGCRPWAQANSDRSSSASTSAAKIRAEPGSSRPSRVSSSPTLPRSYSIVYSIEYTVYYMWHMVYGLYGSYIEYYPQPYTPEPQRFRVF